RFMPWGKNMPDIISIILLSSFLCLVSGLFSPESVLFFREEQAKSRVAVIKIYGLSTVLLFILYSLSGSMETVEEDYIIPTIPSEELALDFEEEDVAVIGEIAANEKIQIQVNSVTSLAKDTLYKPKDGYQFIQVELTIKNMSSDVVGYNQFQFKVVDDSEIVAVPVFSTINSDTALNLGDLVQDEFVTGTIVFEVPIDSTMMGLYYDNNEPLKFDLGSTLETFERLDMVEEVVVDDRVLIGDITENDVFAIQVIEINKLDTLNYLKPKALHEFVEVVVVIKNISSTSQLIYPYAFKMENSLGIASSPSTTHPNEGDALRLSELGPGGCVTGSLIFEQPKDDEELSLIFTTGVISNQEKLKISLSDSRESFETLVSEDDLTVENDVIDIGESGYFDMIELTLNSVSTDLESIYHEPKDGFEYKVVNLTLTNHAETELTYELYDFKLLNESGELIKPIILVLDSEEAITEGNLSSNESVTGIIVFEQPIESQNHYLVFTPKNSLTTEMLMFNMIEE
ncbi:MAG TPA: hypothetical protein DCY20_11350, partial [Firmicutes bacterium]|nr:hypothetical protein [Bacillota bacterium]